MPNLTTTARRTICHKGRKKLPMGKKKQGTATDKKELSQLSTENNGGNKSNIRD